MGGYGGVPSDGLSRQHRYITLVLSIFILGEIYIIHITLAQRGEGGVPGLLTDANRGEGGV